MPELLLYTLVVSTLFALLYKYYVCVCAVHYPFYAVSVPIYIYQFPQFAQYLYYYYYYDYYLGECLDSRLQGLSLVGHFCWKRGQTFDGYTTHKFVNLSSSNLKKSFENSGLRSEGLPMKGCRLNCGH